MKTGSELILYAVALLAWGVPFAYVWFYFIH